MSEEHDLFRQACGAMGPIHLEWDDWRTGTRVNHEFDRPVVRIGSGASNDLVLEHPGVEAFHAYLQVVEGRLFAVDLETEEGLRWSGVPRKAGWFDRARPLQIGPVTIEVVSETGSSLDAGFRPLPISRRFHGTQARPGVVLELRGATGAGKRWPIDRVVTLVGRSDRCQMRLRGPSASPFVCALVHTPLGLWVVDLLSEHGFTINGVRCREAVLEDGDTLQLDDVTARVIYDGSLVTGGESATATMIVPVANGSDANAASPEILLRPFIEGAQAVPDGSSPFGQALLLLVQMLGDMHQNYRDLVREELEHIRRLNQEILSLRNGSARLGKSEPPAEPSSGAPSPAEMAFAAATNGLNGGHWPGFDEPDGPRNDPKIVQTMVNDRIAAWDRERQSRWRKVLELLMTRS